MSEDAQNAGKESDPDGRFPSRRSRDIALSRLLRRHDVLSSTAIRALGYSERELRGLVAHGDLTRKHRGVYLDGRTTPTPWIHLKAALLAVNATAFLSHRTAAAARDYRAINTREIHITVIAAHTPTIRGLILHRTTDPGPGEVSTAGGLRAATLIRILIDLARAGARDTELNELITAGERRNAMTDVAPILDRHAGQPGIAHLTELLQHHLPARATDSGLEDEVWAWYAQQPDLPPPDETQYVLGPYRYDGAWFKERLLLEIDSRTYHQARQDMENDRLKDAYAQRHGFRIIRVTDFRFANDRPGIRADFDAFLNEQAA